MPRAEVLYTLPTAPSLKGCPSRDTLPPWGKVWSSMLPLPERVGLARDHLTALRPRLKSRCSAIIPIVEAPCSTAAAFSLISTIITPLEQARWWSTTPRPFYHCWPKVVRRLHLIITGRMLPALALSILGRRRIPP